MNLFQGDETTYAYHFLDVRQYLLNLVWVCDYLHDECQVLRNGKNFRRVV